MAKENLKILVVEDDPDISTLLVYFLNRNGFTVTSTDDGERALAVIDEICPDVVLLDLMLPKINGFEICQRIKEDKNKENIKVIILSAKSYGADIKKAKKLGADEYMVKPFDKERLLKLLNSYTK